MKTCILLCMIALILCVAHSAPLRTSTGVNVFNQRGIPRLPFNAGSCTECHAVPLPGGSSKSVVIRIGHYKSGEYIPGGPEGIRHVHGDNADLSLDRMSGIRVTLNLLGDGYVEALPVTELRTIAATVSSETGRVIHGEAPTVTLPEMVPGARVIGRFGWKDQHGSLLSATAEALRNELGVPNGYFPATSLNQPYGVGGPSDSGILQGDEIRALVDFLRSTEPIPPDPERSALGEVRLGSVIFDRIGCSICHIRTLKTAPPGTKMEGGNFIVTERLGNHYIHPYSDFLLHDVGTGDGIIQNIRPQDYDKSTANKFRTPPLWGVRYRSWMMHDGRSVTYHQAIMRHGGEARQVVEAYEHLTPKEQDELREFLNSL